MQIVDELDFRTDQPQQIRDFGTGAPMTVRYVGPCEVCRRRCYDDGQCDPRGALGLHAAAPLRAAEHGPSGATGPDVLLCWDCRDTHRRYEHGLAIGLRVKWTVPAPAAPEAQ